MREILHLVWITGCKKQDNTCDMRVLEEGSESNWKYLRVTWRTICKLPNCSDGVYIKAIERNRFYTLGRLVFSAIVEYFNLRMRLILRFPHYFIALESLSPILLSYYLFLKNLGNPSFFRRSW